MIQRENIQTICCSYFSPTGSTKLIAKTVCDTLQSVLSAHTDLCETPWQEPEQLLLGEFAKKANPPTITYSAHSLAVFALPTYAGRLPNLLLPFLHTLRGDNTPAIALVSFGQRSPGDALFELCQLLNRQGFIVIGAATVPTAHAFSTTLGRGRPAAADLSELKEFAASIAGALDESALFPLEIPDADRPLQPYYIPRGAQGEPLDFRKAKPRCAPNCIRCGLCARVCPTGAIDLADVEKVPGVCMKCCACIKQCPVQARYFDNPDYLYHVHDLEERYGDARTAIRIYRQS